jgi:hypothetical protein
MIPELENRPDLPPHKRKALEILVGTDEQSNDTKK